MKFDEAAFVVKGKKEIISLEEIPRRKDFLEVVQHIYCPDPSCEAKLVFNRRSTGVNYLSKHRSDEHNIDCAYFEDEIKPVKSITEYNEINGGLTDKGKLRRKKESMKVLRDYLNPPKPKPKEKNSHKKTTRKKETTEGTETHQGIKVKYDPDGEVVKKDTGNGKVKVKEPPFYGRLPHQLSEKDSGQNLRTSAIINEVLIFKNDVPRAEIKANFDDINITFVLPEAFFVSNERRLQVDDLIEYLSIIKKYVKAHSNYLFLTTMCQSRELDMEDITLYILEPDFMSFQTLDGKDFSTLTSVIAAISTKAI
ncbi:hypothetical protein FDP51_05710 [Enterococcus mundtii]|uniref:hypothetical protein n=2 Tax=Enterococcus TaxID=1350 RepID=UPI00044CB6CE|nr:MULTISPECIES: hypothetical protein [Enterococcus]EYT96371.1 hypothetical protein AK89_03925 [Enterococcus mundtii CRL35]MRI73516.1 hypothetical protein [Enterococcus mundtii]